MIRGKTLQNIEFESNGITEDQLIEFVKIAGELKAKIEQIKQNKKRKNRWYKNASAIRYGELK